MLISSNVKQKNRKSLLLHMSILDYLNFIIDAIRATIYKKYR
jgi:hypothetical protein